MYLSLPLGGKQIFNKKLSKPCPETKRFKEYNTVYTRLVRVARKKYYVDKFKEYSKDCKKKLGKQ